MKIPDLFARTKSLSTRESIIRIPTLIGWVALAALVVAAAVARFSLPPVAVSEYDSWGWLNPALNWLGGAGFREEFEREWLYGAFIALCLKLTGTFSGYVIIQQILGLAAALLIWLTWRTWISLFARSLALEIVSTAVGLLLVALYLFNPITIVLELGIRPEAIMAFVAFLQLLCVVSFCKHRWQEKNIRACIVYGALSLPLAWAMYILKPNWALAVPLTMLPVFLGILGKDVPRLARFLPPALGFALIVFALWLPDKLLFIRTTQTRLVLPMTLFTIHADIIQKSMKRELGDPGTSPERRKFLEGFLPELDREMLTAIEGAKYYKKIGFDPDYLMYRASLFPTLQSEYGMTQPQLAAFCRESFISAVLHHPVDYARKVCIQMSYFFFPDDATFFRKRIDMRELYNYVQSTLPATLNPRIGEDTQALMQGYLAQVKQQAGEKREVEPVRQFRDFLKSAKSFTLPLEIIFLIALGACLLWKPLFFLRLPGLVAVLIFTAPAGNALTVAMVHALDNSRYRGSYGPLLLFALGVMFLFVLVVAAHAVLTFTRKPSMDQR